MRKIMLSLMVAVLSFATVAALPAEARAQEAPATTPETTAPEAAPSVCVLVEVPSLSDLYAHLQDFAAGVYPEAALPPIEAGIQEIMKTSDPTTVNLKAPLQILILEPPLIRQPVIIFSATDVGRYLENLTPGLQATETDGDIRLYQEGDAPGSLLAIGNVGNRVVISPSVDAVKAALDLMKKGEISEEASISAGADIAVQVELRKLLDSLSESMGNPFDMIRGMMFMGMAMNPQAAKVQPILNAYIDAVESMSRQIDNLLVTLSLSGAELRLHTEAQPVAGSGLSNYLASVPRGELRTLKYLPADSMLIWTSKMGDLEPLMTWSRKIMEAMASAGGQDPKALDPLWQWTEKILPIFGDEFSAALLSSDDGLMRLVEVINFKDPAAAAELLAEYPAFVDQLSEVYKDMGMETSMQYKPKAQTHKGMEISEWTFSYKVGTMPGMPPEEAEKAAEMQQKILTTMFGPEMTGYSTFIGNDMVVTFGKDSLAILKEVIDGEVETAAIPGGGSRLAAILEGMPEKPSGIFYISLGEFANWYLNMLGPVFEASGAPLPPQLLQLKFERGPGIVGTWNVSADGVTKDLRVPVEEIGMLVESVTSALQDATDSMPPPPPAE